MKPLRRTDFLCESRGFTIHYVNMPKLFVPLHKIGLRFVKEKLRKRVHLHYNYQSLHEVFSPDILPECLGGGLPDVIAAVDSDVVEQILERNIPYEGKFNYICIIKSIICEMLIYSCYISSLLEWSLKHS